MVERLIVHNILLRDIHFVPLGFGGVVARPRAPWGLGGVAVKPLAFHL